MYFQMTRPFKTVVVTISACTSITYLLHWAGGCCKAEWSTGQSGVCFLRKQRHTWEMLEMASKSTKISFLGIKMCGLYIQNDTCKISVTTGPSNMKTSHNEAPG